MNTTTTAKTKTAKTDIGAMIAHTLEAANVLPVRWTAHPETLACFDVTVVLARAARR